MEAEDLEEWMLDIEVLDQNPLYLNQVFRLKFKFSDKYPIGTTHQSSRTAFSSRLKLMHFHTEPPEVTFLKQDSPSRPVPIHPHIYTNGIICLDLLGDQGWSPVQNVESVCMSIQSMLTGNTKNERPPDDEQFTARNKQRPRDINFYYHDNDV